MVPYHHFRVGGGFQSRRDKTDGDASLHTCRPVPRNSLSKLWTTVQHEAQLCFNLFVVDLGPS